MLIAGTDTFPENVRVIDDGDECSNAEHGATAEDVSNRTRWLKNRVDLLKVLLEGGELEVAAAVTIALGNEVAWIFEGSDSNVIFGTGSRAVFDRNVRGPLFLAGTNGRANRKLQIYSGGSNQAIDPTTHNEFVGTPSAAIELQIANATYVAGDEFRVQNRSTTGGATITVKKPNGDTLLAVPVAVSLNIAWAVFFFDGTDWQLGPRGGGA